MENSDTKYLYSAHVLDLVRLAATYCSRLEEGDATSERSSFVDLMRGLLPMIYLKLTLMDKMPEAEGWLEPTVNEADYDYIRQRVARCMNEHDDYLDVFVSDFKYSDTPILCTISENLADIYQALREFTAAYQTENEEVMAAALYSIQEDFEHQMGQTILNALRALHDTRFGEREGMEE